MTTRASGTRQHPSWVERLDDRRAPPLDARLEGWEIQKKRRSHWNVKRTEAGVDYFLKWFFHGRWRNPARSEWRNAILLARLGIPTVTVLGWGRHPGGTFVVLEGSPGFPLDAWREHGLTEGDLHGLALELAQHVARLHKARLCHKDLNVYHVLVWSGGLRVIDVGRVARFTRRRWVVKDLASLLCSARRERLPQSACRAFFRCYLQQSHRTNERRGLLDAVLRKARRYHRHNENPVD